MTAMFWPTLSAGAFVLALIAAAGVTGLLYALIYAVAIAPGVVLGRALFGPRHAAGWLVGGVLGYGVAQLAIWLPIFAGIPSIGAFVAVWLVVAGLLVWIARRMISVFPQVPPFSAGDVRALALTLMLVPLLMGPPYRNLGRADEAGTRYYRAYFTADFVWHTALAAELGRYASPPRNPYMAARRMHYYWTYFLLPAVVAHELPVPLNDVQRALKANAMLSALFLVGMLFVFVRSAVHRAGIAALAAGLAILAPSAEGSFVLLQLWQSDRPLAAVTDMNIDAITAWQFGGLRIDGIARGLWYNPQHSVACALGLVAAWMAATFGATASRGAIWVSGAALGLSTTFNPFVGGVFSLISGLGVIIDAVRRRQFGATLLLRHAEMAVPVVLALMWCHVNEVADGAGAAIRIGFAGYAKSNTIISLLLSTGPVLLPSLAGLWLWRGLPAGPALVGGVGAAVTLLLMHLVTLSEPSWVGFRTGQILLLLLPVLLARALCVLDTRYGRWSVAALTAVVLVAGLPTTAIDTYNAQDIHNRRQGPGFRWTLPVTPEQQAAFEWIRTSVPETAIVQMEPKVRGREHWSLIPTFGERRMSAGLPISLLPTPEYERGAVEVRQLYATTSARDAWQLARRRNIEYVYVDAVDRAAYPDGVAKFNTAPYFEKAYDNGEVSLYRVR